MASDNLEVRPVPAHMLVASWRDSFFIADMLSGLARCQLSMSEPRRSCSAERACRAPRQCAVRGNRADRPANSSCQNHLSRARAHTLPAVATF